MQSPKVRILRLLLWAMPMCMAGLITAGFEPQNVVFVPCVFLALFVPMVLLALRHTPQMEKPNPSETSPISKTGMEESVKLLWLAGNCFWCAMIPLLWWRGYEAQTAAQASLATTRLEMVAGFGGIWAVTGAVWLAKHRTARES